MTNHSSFFDEHFAMIYSNMMDNYVPEYFKSFEYTPWVFSLLGSVVIGLSGIFPLIIIPTEEKMAKEGYKDRKFTASKERIYILTANFADFPTSSCRIKTPASAPELRSRWSSGRCIPSLTARSLGRR